MHLQEALIDINTPELLATGGAFARSHIQAIGDALTAECVMTLGDDSVFLPLLAHLTAAKQHVKCKAWPVMHDMAVSNELVCWTCSSLKPDQLLCTALTRGSNYNAGINFQLAVDM